MLTMELVLKVAHIAAGIVSPRHIVNLQFEVSKAERLHGVCRAPMLLNPEQL